MERIVKFTDLEAAVAAAYEKYKSSESGSVDHRLTGVDPKLFGISVVLADGTTINKGDTDALFPLGDLMKIPTATLLLQQNTVKELLQKSGFKHGKAQGVGYNDGKQPTEAEIAECKARKQAVKALPVNALNVRLISAVEPTGDPDGKMDIIVSNLTDMIGTPAQLNDSLYKEIMSQANKASEEDVMGDNGYFLYDAAPIAIDITAKMESLSVSAQQLAQMGATIIADGFNPVTKQNVFDGTISERIVALMAGFGPARKRRVPWLVSAGVPAMASFGGGVLAVVPGVMAIAAYSPELCQHGVGKKAMHAIRYITNELGINIFGSARVTIEK